MACDGEKEKEKEKEMEKEMERRGGMSISNL